MEPRRLYGLSYNSVMTTFGYNLFSAGTSSNAGREIRRLIAIALGAPIEFIQRTNAISPEGLTVLMYMFEVEYIGRGGHDSVWGPEFTQVMARERVSMWSNDFDDTDILCTALIGARNGDGWFIFNKFASQRQIAPARIGDMVVYMIQNRRYNVQQMSDLLLNCESAVILKAIMDKIIDNKLDNYVKALMTALRDSGDFTRVSQHVTQKLAPLVANPS